MRKQINFLVLIFICIPELLLPSCFNSKNSGLPELKTENITAITQTTALSGGKILSDGGANITAKGVCWSINAKPTILDPYSTDGSGDASFVSTLTELASKTEYHVRAYATNVEGTAYGDDKTLRTLSFTSAGQIIADHTVVDKFDDIPPYYINQVKKMLFVIAGESHSLGYMRGLVNLESSYPDYDVNYTDTPEANTTSHLRISRTTWGDVNNTTGWINSYGEEDWYTSTTAINRTKAGISYYNTQGIPISAFGFGHCYGDGGTDYITATQSYIDYCTTNGISTKVYFTTGPVESYDASYDKYLMHKQIRDYVNLDATRILFDYADILCWDNDDTETKITVDGHTFPVGSTANTVPDNIGHISNTGMLRLAKAVWWMLARIVGWDGEK
jgi:hypothetical protein